MDERIDDLIVLAALGELSDDEQRELDAAAAADPEVAAELSAMLDTATGVMSATAIEPPPALRAAVLGAISDTPQEPPLGAAPVVSIEAARSRRSGSIMAIMGAAAAVMLVVAGAVFFVSDGADDGPDQFAAVAEADDAVERRLSGVLDGTLTVVHSPSAQAIVIDGAGVPSVDTGLTYVLWLIRGDIATPVAEFRPGDDGSVRQRIDGVDPADAALGVTAERIGEIDTPTEPILASA